MWNSEKSSEYQGDPTKKKDLVLQLLISNIYKLDRLSITITRYPRLWSKFTIPYYNSKNDELI